MFFSLIFLSLVWSLVFVLKWNLPPTTNEWLYILLKFVGWSPNLSQQLATKFFHREKVKHFRRSSFTVRTRTMISLQAKLRVAPVGSAQNSTTRDMHLHGKWGFSSKSCSTFFFSRSGPHSSVSVSLDLFFPKWVHRYSKVSLSFCREYTICSTVYLVLWHTDMF